jgi:Tfp pilus assembly protein PilP
MKKTLLTVAAGTVALTCMAWAQPQGAKETVVIKKETPAAKAPAEQLPPPAVKPRVSRDPFTNGPVTAPPAPPKITTKQPATGGAAATAPARPGEAKLTNTKAVEVVEIAAPEVSVKGILSSRTGNRAIVQGPKMTFIVKRGDKLGDYRVASITNKAVVFTFKDKKFPVKLDDEFGGGDKK